MDVSPPDVISPARARLQGAARVLLHRAGVDRAVFFGAVSRVVQLLSGPVTLLLIARHMSPATQGYYYTFGSILALQSFLELGFYLVIINFASHEWAKLGLSADGQIIGDGNALSRLVSLGRLVFAWYGVISLLFTIAVGTAGYVFFSTSANAAVAWRAPWVTLVLLTAGLLWALPFISILEGCNQVATINRFRLMQTLFGNAALWTTMALGGGLWATVAWAAVNLVRDLYLLLGQYRRFFAPFVRPPSGPRIHWATEVWPMQWRLALSGVVNYFAFSLFTPVMFRYHGPTVAGRMGMTWALATGVQSVALMWVYPKVPTAGMYIARGDYEELDRFWLRTSMASIGLITLGLATVWAAIYALNVLHHPLATRMLSPLAAGLLMLGVWAAQFAQCATAYLRAHKRDPTVTLSVVTSLLIGAAVWFLGSRLGPTGAAAGYLVVTALLLVPWEAFVLRRCRAAWHGGVA